MFPVFEKEKVVTVCMIVCFLLSILLRCLIGAVYRKLLKEVDNMATTNNKLLRQCKLKYSNCYKLNNGVSNTSIFVERFLNRISVGKLSMEMLYHLSGQLMLLSVVFSGIGICRRIVAGSLFGEILPFYIVSFFGLYLYFSLSAVIDVQGRRRTLKINLTDYLENHLAYRIDVTEEDMRRLYGRRGSKGKITRENGRTVELIPLDGGYRGQNLPKAVGENMVCKEEENSEQAKRTSTDMTMNELDDLLKDFLSLS